MSLNWDEKTAIYLSLAEPDKVWTLLDTFDGQRFARTLQAKQELNVRFSSSEWEELARGRLLEVYEREVWRDSRRCFWPGHPLQEHHLPWIFRGAKMAFLLRQIRPKQRKMVLRAMAPGVVLLLEQHLSHKWHFSPTARHRLCTEVKFDADLFQCFAERAPSSVAEWLLDRLFLGVRQVCVLCEISPLKIRPVNAFKGPKFRGQIAPVQSLEAPVQKTCEDLTPLTRQKQLAIVLMSLPPELSTLIFRHLGPYRVKEICREISALPPLSAEQRRLAILEVTGVSRQDLECLARGQTESLARHLQHYLEQAPQGLEAPPCSDPPAESLSPQAKSAAIVMRSLPPEVTAQIFRCLGKEVVHTLTIEICKLPPIPDELRQQTILEVTTMLPGGFENFARQYPEPTAQLITQYLSRTD